MKSQGAGTREQGLEGRDRGAGVRRFAGPGLVLLAAAVAVVPMLVRGDSCGHDFDFHLVSWFDALHAWRHGVVYPHWAPSPNFNAGEPRFIFYPPLTWMLGAALGAVLPWGLVAPAMVFLLLAGTGLATRALARQVLSEGASTLAGCVAIFSGYTLYTAYERSAFAELTGGLWVALLLLLVLREDDVRTAGSRRWVNGAVVWLAIAMAGAWLSNAPVGVMTSYLLAGFAVAVAVARRSWGPMVRAAAGGALGLALAAFYILPAAYERHWVAIQQATDDPGERIENSFLFAHHADPQLALHDAELHRVSWIAVAMLGAIALALLVSWRRRTLWGNRRWWLPLALIPVAVLVLQLPVSRPVWDLLPELRFLQFPWRWLVVLEPVAGVFVAAAVWSGSRRWRPWAAGASAVVFVGMTLWAGRNLFQVCDQYDAVPGMLHDYGDGGGYIGTDEYAPVGADNSLVAQSLPDGCLVEEPAVELGKTSPDDPQPDWSADQKSCLEEFEFAEGSTELHRRMATLAELPGYVVLRLRRFRAWDVRVNGAAVSAMPWRDDGLVVVAVPAGHATITADWQTTQDVVLGRWISLGALALLLGVVALGRRRAKSS